jgi:hypothetical protein
MWALSARSTLSFQPQTESKAARTILKNGGWSLTSYCGLMVGQPCLEYFGFTASTLKE